MSTRISRRQLLAGGLAAGALAPRWSWAQSKTLVVATFPGTWNEAHRQILAPYFRKRTGASVTQSILLAQDQIARLVAARGGQAPFDVAILDDPQVLDAIKQELIIEYPAAKSPHWKELLPQFQDKWGPKISMQVIGIGYNPKRIAAPPRSWDELWNPKYKGRGVPVELAMPETGPVGWRTSLHLVKGAVEPDLAVQYIDSHVAAEVQADMLKPPFDVIPTNGKVPLTGDISQAIARTHADLAKIRTIDWEKINPQRGALIERFNR